MCCLHSGRPTVVPMLSPVHSQKHQHWEGELPTPGAMKGGEPVRVGDFEKQTTAHSFTPEANLESLISLIGL